MFLDHFQQVLSKSWVLQFFGGFGYKNATKVLGCVELLKVTKMTCAICPNQLAAKSKCDGSVRVVPGEVITSPKPNNRSGFDRLKVKKVMCRL